MMISDEDILAVASTNSNIPGPRYICTFGKKYPGKTALVIYNDQGYCEFLEKLKNEPYAQGLIESIKCINKIKYDIFKKNTKLESITDFVLNFGKYKGLKVSEIISTDEQYIIWLINNPSRAEGTYLNLYRIEKLYKPSPKEIPVSSTSSPVSAEKLEKIEENSDFGVESIIISPKISKDQGLSSSVSTTYEFYKLGKTINEIAAIRKFKSGTIIDHLSTAIDNGYSVDLTPEIDVELYNSILEIINEKMMDNPKLKAIKEMCDELGLDATYDQIKLTIIISKQ